MNGFPWLIATGAALAAVGLWWLLPWGGRRLRGLGWLPLAAAGGIAAAGLLGLGEWLSAVVLLTLTAVTLTGGVGTVTARNPVYAAVWFAVTLLGTAALLLCQGAQFLALATIVVYAGAILVTFLFLLMLAQPRGRAVYDRVSWQPHLGAFTGMLLVAVLSAALTDAAGRHRDLATLIAGRSAEATDSGGLPTEGEAQPTEDKEGTSQAAENETEQVTVARVSTQARIARLGAELFGPRLLAVEAIGVLLLVALVGAALIAARPVRRETADSHTAPGGASSSGDVADDHSAGRQTPSEQSQARDEDG